MDTQKDQTLIAGIVNIWSWLVGVAIALFIDRLKKRTLFLVGTAGMIGAFIVWTAMAARYEIEGKDAYGISVVAMIFVYNSFYGISFLPLTVAYPLELCTTKQRSLFFSYTVFAISMSAFIVNYINPIGIENLAWKYYILTIVFTCFIWTAMYFFFVKTKGSSLEEIAIIFDGREGFEAAIVAVTADERKMKVDTLEEAPEKTAT